MNRPSPSRVRVSGPLEAYATGFREELSTLGYSARSATGHLQLMAHLSRWLIETGLRDKPLNGLPQVAHGDASPSYAIVHRFQLVLG